MLFGLYYKYLDVSTYLCYIYIFVNILLMFSVYKYFCTSSLAVIHSIYL